MPRGANERGSWQIYVVAQVLQCAQFQCLTANLTGITPVKKVDILHLSTPPVRAGVAEACPCDRTRTGTQSALKTTSYVSDTSDNCTRTLTHLLSIFECVLVLPLYPPYGHARDDRLRFDPLDRSM